MKNNTWIIKRLVSQLSFHSNKLAIVLDQIIFSCMTLAVNLISARHLSIEDYGILMLIVTAGVLFVGMQRSAFGEPLMIMAETFKKDQIIQSVNRKILLLGILAGLTFSGFTIASVYIYSGSLYIGLLSLSALFLNDAIRFISIANDHPYISLLNTTSSSIFQLLSLGILYFNGVDNYIYYLYAWALGAVAGPIASIIVSKNIFSRQDQSIKIPHGEYWTLSSRFSIDYAMGILSLQGSLWTATAVTGPAAAAALRGADTLLGPFRVFLQSMPALVLKSWAQTAPRLLFKKLLASIGKVWLLAAIWNLVFLMIPDQLGYAVLGESWSVIRPIMVLVLLSLFPITISNLCLVALKALKDTHSVLVTRFIIVPIGLMCGVGGAYINGAEGAATGALISSVVAAIIFLYVVYKTTRK